MKENFNLSENLSGVSAASADGEITPDNILDNAGDDNYSRSLTDAASADAYVSPSDNLTADAVPSKTSKQEQFDSLIRGEYSDVFSARVQDIVKKRLRSSKEKAQKYDELSPSLELLAQKYKTLPGDIAALNMAIQEELSRSRQTEEDDCRRDKSEMCGQTSNFGSDSEKNTHAHSAIDSNFHTPEDNAKTVDDPKVAAEHSVVIDASLIDEARAAYPDFDLDKELLDPDFARLTQNGISPRLAYEVIHRDSLAQAAVDKVIRSVEQKTLNNIISQGQRPRENGSSASGVVIRPDMASISRADRAEINRRVSMGEKIYL